MIAPISCLGACLLFLTQQFVYPVPQRLSSDSSDYPFELSLIHPDPAAFLTTVQGKSLESMGL
jgi:hypothetical protein